MGRHGDFIAALAIVALIFAYMASTTKHPLFTWGEMGQAAKMNQQFGYPAQGYRPPPPQPFGSSYGQPQGGYPAQPMQQGYAQPYQPQQFGQ